jgi:signal transduction histidine kinase
VQGELGVSDGRSDDAGDRASHLGFVAHEVRNPMSTALWTAELMSRMSAEERGGPRGEKLAAMCQRSIARVRQLVEDHLLSERLDAGGIPLRLEDVGARQAVGGAVERRTDPGALTVDGDDVGIRADRMLLERALEALVAVSGRDGAPVRVSLSADDTHAVIVVSGQPATADALQDPIKGSLGDQRGRALALPMARRIAQALGGALAASSGGWVLTLPRAAAYTARPNPPAHP